MCIDAQATCGGASLNCVNGGACSAGNICCLSLLGGEASCVAPTVCNFAGGLILCASPSECPSTAPACCRFRIAGICQATCN
jgi:hypothetical protein